MRILTWLSTFLAICLGAQFIGNQLIAMGDAKVIRVLVKAGDVVSLGMDLMTIEVMKMQLTIKADQLTSGVTVASVAELGEVIKKGDALISF